MITCYLGLGSNLGNRRRNIQNAILELSKIKGVKVLQTSTFINTKAVGGPKNQPNYLNAAIKIKTSIPAQVLLKKIKNIEIRLGRIKSVRNGPRIIDIDILFYGEKKIQTKKIVIPHPRVFKRDFVIKPLSEVICA
ncbi:MAG: 2-amino-4-hydroxy-6-hydroxymethyldihydropteridine diphosphokinase [Candidatus Omnitrophota bacterium]